MYKHLLSIFILLIFISIASAESDLDSVSFATYYPAPYGVYHEMRTDQQSIGAGYRDDVVPENSLIVEGNVGIGTATPQANLDVGGGVKIGQDTVCNANKKGTLTYISDKIKYCGESGWKTLSFLETVTNACTQVSWATSGCGSDSCTPKNPAYCESNTCKCPSGYTLKETYYQQTNNIECQPGMFYSYRTWKYDCVPD